MNLSSKESNLELIKVHLEVSLSRVQVGLFIFFNLNL